MLNNRDGDRALMNKKIFLLSHNTNASVYLDVVTRQRYHLPLTSQRYLRMLRNTVKLAALTLNTRHTHFDSKADQKMNQAPSQANDDGFSRLGPYLTADPI